MRNALPLIALLLTILLAACNSVPSPTAQLANGSGNTSTLTAPPPIAEPAKLEASAKVPLADARVAFAPVIGADPQTVAKLGAKLGAAAASRGLRVVPLTDPTRTHFVKGYLASKKSDSGETLLTYVWDIHDLKGKRLQRLSDEISDPNAKFPTPWVGASDGTLTTIATRSVEKLANWYGGTGS